MEESSVVYLEKQLERLLDIINMSQNSLTLRIEDSLEVLDEVRDMDILAGQ